MSSDKIFEILQLESVFYKKKFKDVSREFDEFQVNTHLCKLAALLVLVMYNIDEFFLEVRIFGPL